jgi:hypothetical protein
MVTNDLVDRVTDWTGIQRGGCGGRHRACSNSKEPGAIIWPAAKAELSLNLAQQEKLKRDESATVPTRTTKQASNSSTDAAESDVLSPKPVSLL